MNQSNLMEFKKEDINMAYQTINTDFINTGEGDTDVVRDRV